MTQTQIYFDDSFKDHVSSLDYPERTDRVKNIIDLINNEEFKNISIIKPNKVDYSHIYEAHDKRFVDEATLKAAGAGIDAADNVINKKCMNAFCIVRPPGHHACYDRSMGFCVFNNVAISAKYLINRYGLENIAIIDFDVHHGNGTQDIFYENSQVHYYSTHQYPLYPGTGDTNEKGVGNIVNVPLQAGTNSSQYQSAFDEMIIKKLHDQKPDFLILSAGFDAHEKDPLASLELLENDFKLITQKLMSIADKYCDNRIISMLEGGYDIQALENSMITHIRELQNND